MTEIETLKIILNEYLPEPTMIDNNKIIIKYYHLVITN